MNDIVYEEQKQLIKMWKDKYDEKKEEIERLHSIIKEVREEIRILVTNCDIADYQAQKLFQILDKVGETDDSKRDV